MIEQTRDYTLDVGESKEQKGVVCYQITNKNYGVVEVETNILPQALKYIEDLQVGLDARRDMKEEDSTTHIPKDVIPIKPH